MNDETPQITRSFGTHSGSFHADEVTACALLLLFDLIDRDKIVRTRDPAVLARCEYVCDVGGVYDPSKKLFDHHQHEYEGPLSSAGMILLYLKEEGKLSSKAYTYAHRSLVHGIDLHDNGEEPQIFGYCTFSHVVANFNSIEHGVSSSKQDLCFFSALDFVLGHLTRLMKRFEYIDACRDDVKKAMETQETLLVFKRPVAWLEPFFEMGGDSHPAQFLIMPTGQHWKLRSLPPTYEDRMNVRTPLPEAWAGLQHDELKEASGIEGAIFCHKGRFISVWETIDDAKKAFDLVMKKETKNG